LAAPAQTGSKATAMMNLSHFGTAERIQNLAGGSEKERSADKTVCATSKSRFCHINRA
jgi:hypothetical protein